MQLDPRDPEARIARLVDSGEFTFLVPRTNCGMVAVTGLIKGNKVVIFASDPTIKSGALGVDGSKVIVTAYKAAMGAQVPIIGMWHSGGARLSDGVASLDAFGEVFQTMISASGRTLFSLRTHCRWRCLRTSFNRCCCTCTRRAHICNRS